MKVDRVTANHSLSSTAIQQKFQHSLSLLSLSQDVTARQKFIHFLVPTPGESLKMSSRDIRSVFLIEYKDELEIYFLVSFAVFWLIRLFVTFLPSGFSVSFSS